MERRSAMPRIFAFVSLVTLAAAVAFGCDVRRPNYRALTMLDGSVATAHLDGWFEKRDEFFSVRLRDAAVREPLQSLAHLHLRGHDYLLRDLVPEHLRALGISVASTNYVAADEEFAFIGFGDQNRVGGLEFWFASGRLRKFFGRCHVRAQCGFELSWPDHSRFSLPIAGRDLLQRIDPPMSVEDYWGK